MKLDRLLIIGILISTELLNAQNDYRPGYIIKNSGDTLYGEINYRSNLLVSSICMFKDADNTVYNYSPDDLAAYRFIDSKYYVSREIESKKVFLEYLIKGKVSIYYMHNEEGDHYYLDKENVGLTELPYEEGTKYIDDKYVYYESTKHIALLNYYLQDAPGFTSRIQSIKRPEHQNLIKLAEDYHNATCKGEKCIIYEKKFPLIRFSITPFAGLVKYIGYNELLYEFGGYLFMGSPVANEKLFFKTGLTFHQLSEEESRLNIFKIPLQVQYIYRAHKLQPKVSGGINILTATLDKYHSVVNTLSLNAGLNYMISKRVSLSTGFSSDYTPLRRAIIDGEFGFISYSFYMGCWFDL